MLNYVKKQLPGIETYIPDDFNIENYEEVIESSVYPFNLYEFVISYLLGNNFMTFCNYLYLRKDYIIKNRHLDKFEMSGKKVGKYIEDLLLEGNFGLEKPSREIDKNFSQQTSYDAYMKLNGKIIRIEIKAARFTDRKIKTDNLMEKAIYYSQVFEKTGNIKENIDVDFWLNFQQLKPKLADIFIFAGIFRDQIVYWVFSSKEIEKFWIDGQHSGNKGNEGQLHIKTNNIKDYIKYMVEASKLKEEIISKFNS